ncbi:SH3 domain-containing protein [Bacillus sp. FJAT-49711]|uniref:SH3 domain-containing protein n=1 Tax=Bacillus sp. FJAT-49711 TaxID=2833585 RepID=UPI001BC9F094|nr:SH3 domain-containing protein [Bacillus sp. FJAT-49711]MBS4220503.1 SH3 domain-containing protein [Bacillus sp. FJAT-49711]
MLKKVFAIFVAMLILLTGLYIDEPVHAASQTKYVTASALNVRTGPSTKNKVITIIKKNHAVKVTQTSGSWDKVKVGSKTGWVSNKYLTTKKPTTTTKKKTTSKTMYVTASVLNVRSGPSTNYKVVTTIKKGQSVIVNQTKGSWGKIKVGSKTGWVSTKYLTATKPAASKNLAAGLKTIRNNKQLILVTTNGLNTSSAEIRTFEKDSKGKWVPVLATTGYIGKYGFTSNMSEGGKKSPIGKYTIGTAFGSKKNPGTKLSYRNITDDDVWVDDPKSSLYNTWQSRKKTKGKWKSAENMNIPAYTYGFVINYNTKRIPNKGSAIFFHIGNSYTLGCTATSEANVVKILKWLDPKKNPVIIQTPIQDLKKY